MKNLRNHLAVGLTAVLLSGSCNMRMYHGRQEFPTLGFALVFEAKPEEEGRNEIYSLACIARENTASMEGDSQQRQSHKEIIKEDLSTLMSLIPVQNYAYQERFFFVDSLQRICSLDRLQEKASSKTSSAGYALEFTYAVPEGEKYTLHCGNTPATPNETKHSGSYQFFDSAENECVFKGFPGTNLKTNVN